ncbi:MULTISPECIES: hypothetical protein [Luteimonas]|uniref:hypothetical protein n=1 Tax=Luteimonas TaxID=83614 RepID=UPI000C7E71F8|nr:MULTISPECIES: hypothetical protein [Luteimonas]
MNAADPAPDPAPPPRRGLRLLLFALIGLVALALLVRLLLPPERALRLVLAQLEPTLGLQIDFEGEVDYRLRGTPQLVVRDVVARIPGDVQPLLQAERVLLSLPWKTIRSRGAELEIARVELDAPQLHLPTLLRWLDARPPGDGKVPAFTDGARIVRGSLLADGWRIDGLAIDVPSLYAARPLDARLGGTFVSGALQAPFRLHATADRVVDARELTAVGTVSVEQDDAVLSTTLEASATRVEATAGLRLSPLRVAMDARWRDGDIDLPFALGLHGTLAVESNRVRFAPVGIATRADGLVPTFSAGGRVALGRMFDLSLDGALARWPEAWPLLPPPIGDSDAPVPFALRYRGPTALDAPIGLRVAPPGATFDGSARIADIVAWLDAGATGAPLPAMRGSLRADRIDISGAQLDGVQIEFDDGSGDAPATRP